MATLLLCEGEERGQHFSITEHPFLVFFSCICVNCAGYLLSRPADSEDEDE